MLKPMVKKKAYQNRTKTVPVRNPYFFNIMLKKTQHDFSTFEPPDPENPAPEWFFGHSEHGASSTYLSLEDSPNHLILCIAKCMVQKANFPTSNPAG